MDAHDESSASLSPTRERPWLLPYNRKLRHLQGITIRNLTLTPTPARPRTQTIDDEAIPSTLESPAKALAQREHKALTHSRSSSDLKAREEAARRGNGELLSPASLAPPKKLQRPGVGKSLRRRSTLEWSGASPLTRQKKLEDIAGSRMADTFFSLHVDDQIEPVYISEVVDRAMNPNFRFFDLASGGPGVTRLDKLAVRVWARSEETKSWQYLIEFAVQLRSLQFIGKTLENFRHPLPQNCILFHMTDGIYTSFTDMPVAEKFRFDDFAPPKEHPEGRTQHSSSYDALMRLNTLDDCIQDALATRDRLAEEIESILKDNQEAISTIEQVPEAEERLKTVDAAVAAEKRRVDAVRRKRDDLQASIQKRRELMQKGRELDIKHEKELDAECDKHSATKEACEKILEDITGQRRRICEDLQTVFPIEPVPGKSLLFTIRGLVLPNGDFDDVDELETAAALSYVGQVLNLLSPYLSIILPYPITMIGSTSTIDDPLAIQSSANPHNNPRTYPLFPKGVVRYRFEYGVFLVNKNIEVLSNALGLRPIDIRHTLPNLKYLLFVATAGKGELPARKSGGIRGLLGSEGFRRRKGSGDSTGSGSSFGASVEGKGGGAGAGVGAAGIDKEDRKGNRGEVKVHLNGAPVPSFAKMGLQKSKGGFLPGSRLREVE
ncbi:UV radiation resistance-associated gene protein [Massarina eburnea CBS 473.64]|uniref:Autophagy-related protein 14 n=1 Tax=Massarina eburnea CBS 473.64 TaxID=1395130 RepID=A0A6A6SAL2_9PLEO|nr:UV radiation resistance-associated gene protein [Massarina eburnea CBS 473.64]